MEGIRFTLSKPHTFVFYWDSEVHHAPSDTCLQYYD